MVKKVPQYKKLYHLLKHDILTGNYKVGDLLPSELELSIKYKMARATVRQALSALEKEGKIEKKQGKGSIVSEGNNKLGILSIKNFSSITRNTSNDFILKPHKINWPESFVYEIPSEQLEAGCIFMKRIKKIDEKPVILELTYLPDIGLPDFCATTFINDSLTETLKNKYLIEFINVEEDIRAVKPCDEAIRYLEIKRTDPLLQINFKFTCNRSELNVYSIIYCDTQNFSVGKLF
jgi:GntR family transcriptional regulator/GntR family frlABCD operon transcriptional regulator